MVINTQSRRVIENRKVIVKLMLASHPDSCLLCDKGNRCQLRKIAADLGIGLVEFYRMPYYSEIQEANPFIQRDLSKCILCGKCIRVDQELVVVGAIDYNYRGFEAKPTTMEEKPLEKSECTLCGTCVVVCPTGALNERERRFKGTVNRRVSSVCPYCGCGCAIQLEVAEKEVVGVRPEERNSINGITLCVKGHYGFEFIHSKDRLTIPLIRQGEDLRETSWEEALKVVVKALKGIKEKNGGDALAFLGSTKCTNEENYLFQKFARGVIGTNHIDNESRLYASSSQMALEKLLGIGAATNPLRDIEEAEAILVIGANPEDSSPIVGYAIKRATKWKKAKLILIDPRETRLSRFALIWMRPKVGTDLILINGLIRLIIEEGLWDVEFVAKNVRGLEALKNSVKLFSPHYVERMTGITLKELEETLRLWIGAEKAYIVYGNGVTQGKNSSATLLSLLNFALLTGKLTGERGGIYPIERDNNGQGARTMGCLPDYLPGYQRIEDERGREKFEKAWKVKIPEGRGLTALEMMKESLSRRIRGMYIMGEDPMSSFPNTQLVREGLSSLEFLVVQDIFLTETAKLATVVLPAVSFAEKEGTFTNQERKVQRIRKAIEPLGEGKADWQIIAEISSLMGYTMDYSSPKEIMDEIATLVPIYRGISYERLENGGLYWPSSGHGHPGSPSLFPESLLKVPIEFALPDYESTKEKVNRNYPFSLISGSTLYHFASGVRSSKARGLIKMTPSVALEINREDALELGIKEGDEVWVRSPKGEVRVNVKINETLPKKTIFLPSSLNGSSVHSLQTIDLDALSNTPQMKVCQVKVERV
jgi:formate dehydrogenase alpha subunit